VILSNVTGPEAVTLYQVADELSPGDRPHRRLPCGDARGGLCDARLVRRPRVGGRGLGDLVRITTGELDVVSDTAATVAGHPPMSLADYLREYPDSYRHLLAR